MMRFRCAVVLAALSAAVVITASEAEAGLASSPGEKDKNKNKDKSRSKDGNDIKGTLWTYSATIVNAKGKEKKESGTLRTHEYKVYRGGNQIGAITKTAPGGMQMNITEGKLKGSINLVQTRNDPPQFQGEWVQRDGDKGRILLRFKND